MVVTTPEPPVQRWYTVDRTPARTHHFAEAAGEGLPDTARSGRPWNAGRACTLESWVLDRSWQSPFASANRMRWNPHGGDRTAVIAGRSERCCIQHDQV
jgi:hypothetical protein